MAKVIKNHTTPLCFLPDGRLVCYRFGSILVYENDIEVIHLPIFNSIKNRFIGRSNIFSRLLRIGVRTAISIDNNLILLSISNWLYELDLLKGEISNGYYCGPNKRPLYLTSVCGISGFNDGIYYGDYFNNPIKNTVSIHHRLGPDKWEIAHTFSEGEINHVHNIIEDPYRGCLWIFTGDFDKSAAIWKVSDGFRKVEKVLSNDQKYRGCVAFVIPEGVLYSTDTPFKSNNIYLLRENCTVHKISDVSGSCIYGCQWRDKYVFSTAVEADGRNESPLRLLLGWKRGPGIKDNYAHLYAGNLKEGFKEIYKEKKDFWPFIFQFGVLKFPAGLNKSDTLFFQPVATKNDMKLMGIEE